MTPATSPLSRRTLLRGALGLGALALGGPAVLSACASGATNQVAADGTRAMTYQLSWLPTTEHSGSWIASDRGFYRDGGLSVEFLNGGPNTSRETVVMSGKALVGGSEADVVAKAITQGADLKIIGTRFQKSPFCILSLADTPIKSPQEMVGKKIGVAAANETVFNLLLKINNIDPASIDVVPVQFDPAPVANREVDGQVVFVINEPTQLEAKGIDTHTFLFADHGYTLFSGVYFAKTQTVRENPEQLSAFLLAERRGWEANIADPQLGADLTVNVFGKDQGFDRAQQLVESRTIPQIMVTPDTNAGGLLTLPPALMEQNIKTLNTAGIAVTADQLFTTSILDRL
ncbi:ABC transporter substrate-binding protein [Rhodococcus sp. X156]|uniref:ABC transporter substrate-binding protein n=1 Tax=Rhodococcus sp. X156 TaxID=2499145 RepID=UPI000FDBFA79|nr:ABC transporter substrate-binding protein [Rhodococcus sp. X156]